MPSAFLSGGGNALSSVPGGATGDPLSATYSIEPSGLALTPRGRFPKGMVTITRWLAVSITLRSPDISLVTNSRPAGVADDDGERGEGVVCEGDAGRSLEQAVNHSVSANSHSAWP